MMRLIACLVVCAVLSVPVVGAEDDATGPKVTTKKTEQGRESRIRVLLPSADAKLWFEDTLTKAKGPERSFKSPALQEGKRYLYRVSVTWMENGKEVSHESKVAFTAGEDVLIDFRR